MRLLVLGAITCLFFIGLAALALVMARREERRAQRLNRALTNLEAPVSAGAKLARSRIRANWLISETHDEPPSKLDELDWERYVSTGGIPIVEVPTNEDSPPPEIGEPASS